MATAIGINMLDSSLAYGLMALGPDNLRCFFGLSSFDSSSSSSSSLSSPGRGKGGNFGTSVKKAKFKILSCSERMKIWLLGHDFTAKYSNSL